MTPQCKTLLTHLVNAGSITDGEARLVYSIRALPRRIADLKDLGVTIEGEMRQDMKGQRYKRYHFLDCPAHVASKAGVKVSVAI